MCIGVVFIEYISIAYKILNIQIIILIYLVSVARAKIWRRVAFGNAIRWLQNLAMTK